MPTGPFGHERPSTCCANEPVLELARDRVAGPGTVAARGRCRSLGVMPHQRPGLRGSCCRVGALPTELRASGTWWCGPTRVAALRSKSWGCGPRRRSTRSTARLSARLLRQAPPNLRRSRLAPPCPFPAPGKSAGS